MAWRPPAIWKPLTGRGFLLPPALRGWYKYQVGVCVPCTRGVRSQAIGELGRADRVGFCVWRFEYAFGAFVTCSEEGPVACVTSPPLSGLPAKKGGHVEIPNEGIVYVD